MKKVRFIINPHSGVGKKGKLQRTIEACLKQRQVEYEICFTEGPGHATLLCEEAVKAGYEAVVAVGGDGSVNETARGLVHTDTALGIIPAGSGNGFARHCRIPLNKAKAIDAICNMNTALTDTGKLNDQLFVGTAGLGFDAHISRLFTGFGKRGFGSYIRLVAKEYRQFQPREFQLEIDGKNIRCQAMLVAIANAGQYGNGACISPKARCDDGLLDVVVMKKFPVRKIPHVIYGLFSGRFDALPSYVSIFRGKNIHIKQEDEIAHIDGEAIESGNQIDISIYPLSMKVIIPKLRR